MCEECRASQECNYLWVPTDRCTQPQIVGKLVRFTDVDWVTIPARKEKKEKAEFWDAVEGRSEEAMVEDIFCDALDHHFFLRQMHRQHRDSRAMAARLLGREDFKEGEGGGRGRQL